MDKEEQFYPAIRIIAWIFLVLVIITLVFCFYPRGTVKYAVTNYEWFYDQYNVIVAMQTNIDSMKNKPLSERQEIELQGMRLVLNNNISEYNSKTRQITRGLFKAKDLPYQITIGDR